METYYYNNQLKPGKKRGDTAISYYLSRCEIRDYLKESYWYRFPVFYIAFVKKITIIILTMLIFNLTISKRNVREGRFV